MTFIPLKMSFPATITWWHDAIKGRGFIGGGSIRCVFTDELAKDLDIFCFGLNEEHALNYFNEINNIIRENGYSELFDNPLLRRFVAPIDQTTGELESDILIDLIKPRQDQWMKTYGSNMEEVISNFDFSICRTAMMSSSLALVDEDFEKDIEGKFLRIKNVVCPISTVKRIAKYATYGYKTNASQIVKLFTEWKNRDDEQIDQLVDLLFRSEHHQEMSDEEVQIMMMGLYVD
jgi:hypothetical protein